METETAPRTRWASSLFIGCLWALPLWYGTGARLVQGAEWLTATYPVHVGVVALALGAVAFAAVLARAAAVAGTCPCCGTDA